MATIAEQMAANSAAWKTATAAQKTVLHDANIALSKQSGQSYNSSTGTYSTPVSTQTALPQGTGMNKDGSANTAGLKDLGYGFSSVGDINTAPWKANTYEDSVKNIGQYSTDYNKNREALVQSSLKSGNWDAYNAFDKANSAGNSAPSTGQSVSAGIYNPYGSQSNSSQPSSYTPPAQTGLTFDQAKGQVSGQIDPMFARALEALQAQKRQDQLNGDQLGMARGGAHSGLAADLQNKVGIAASGKASDLDAQRQTQIAQMAQDLVKYGQDYDLRNKQAALAEYLGLNQLDLQKQGQQADYTGIFNGMQTMQSKNADRGYGLDLAGLTGNYNGNRTIAGQQLDINKAIDQRNFDYGVGQDAIKNDQWNQTFDYNVGVDSRDFNYKKAQDSWNQTFQKEQFNDQKAARIWEQTFKTKSFEQDMKDAAAARGLQWASLNQRDKEFIADSAYREKTFQANQDQQKLDNAYRDNKPATGNFNLDDFKGYINQNYYKDAPANPANPFDPKTTKQFDSAGARRYIIGQNLPDAQTDQLLKLYNLPTG